jgi:glycosyltransferase involved in cell wall biosynthesis
MKKFAILISSLDSRKRYLVRLMERIKPQITDEVELVVFVDAGDTSIGEKRNELIRRSTAEYIAFVDDDDLIAPDYVARILRALERNPDCVGIEGIITFDGKNPKKFIHSLRYRRWFERGKIYYRNPNHLNPIKREIVLREPFLAINQGEDSDFSSRVLKHLRNEVYVGGPIYFYEFRTQKVDTLPPELPTEPTIEGSENGN